MQKPIGMHTNTYLDSIPLIRKNHIVMVEPYDNGETISGWIHCTDGHTYTISESEYRALVELLGETRPY